MVYNANSMQSDSQIANFFNNQSVFITGASGFLGKVLVEKLLRTCPGIKHLYLLLRSKKGLSSKQRLDELIKGKIFDNIRECNPNCLNKLIAISGDITEESLGINENDHKILTKEVSIVFHSAATVRFDEPLRVAINYNILGTKRVIELAHKMQRLTALVHVSTAYSNCDRKIIEEIIYEQKLSAQQLIDASKWMSDEMIEKLLPNLLEDRPNTYTFTKAIAETLIVEECGQLPVAIVRPSIVTASWKDPCPGWIDNINNITGIFLAASKGVLRTVYAEPLAVIDIIPVDIVINLLIAVAWNTAIEQTNNILIYNCTSGSNNPITIEAISNLTFPLAVELPCSEHYRYPDLTLRNSRWLNNLYVVLDHYLPAYLFDLVRTFTGGKRMMVRIYDKLQRAVEQLVYFATRQWQFESTNLPKLLDQLSPTDKEMFCFDIREVDWPTYLRQYYLGIRKYILKEDVSTLSSAKKKLNRLFYTNKILEMIIYLGIFNFVLFKTDLTSTLSFLLKDQTNSTVTFYTQIN